MSPSSGRVVIEAAKNRTAASACASRLDTLALTACWTAAARAFESRRDDRLFDDPWAAGLAGQNMVDAFDRIVAKTGAGIADLHAVTTRFFDDFLLQATGVEGIRQVVLVAAGFDARAFRLIWPPLTRLFELDQPGVLAYKAARLSPGGAASSCERHAAGIDLHAPWADALCGLGFDPAQRSAWLLEAFLYFLPEAAVRMLLQTIADLAAPGSVFGADLVNDAVLTCPSKRHWNDHMAAAGAPWLFTSEEPEMLLANFGWTAHIVQPGEAGADFGRLPKPAPRNATGEIPRAFLVTARR